MLLNQTWVHSPTFWQSPSTDTELWWRSVWHLFARCQACRSNQSILKKINPEYSLDKLMLKLQRFDHLMWYEPIYWKRPRCCQRLRTAEGSYRGWDSWMASPNGHEFEQTPGDSEGQESLACMGLQRVGHNLATNQQLRLRSSRSIPRCVPNRDTHTNYAYMHRDMNVRIHSFTRRHMWTYS